MSACLDENTVVAFAYARLSEAARGVAEAHLDDCAICRTMVAEAARSTAIEPQRELTAWLPRGTERGVRRV
jgi:eukaryotic-like serine/threonine-protein kinase